MTYNFMTAAEAASLIKDGEIIALSGFTPAGSPSITTPIPLPWLSPKRKFLSYHRRSRTFALPPILL